MQTRREFIRSAAALTGGTIALGAIPEAVARAMAIEPAAGTTFRDAEHVVILMQENRSFDTRTARCAASVVSVIRARTCSRTATASGFRRMPKDTPTRRSGSTSIG